MATNKFTINKDLLQIGRKVWMRGNDTCGNPCFEIHAPYDRVAAADSFLLYFVNPSERQFKAYSDRSKWLKFSTYKQAKKYADTLKG